MLDRSANPRQTAVREFSRAGAVVRAPLAASPVRCSLIAEIAEIAEIADRPTAEPADE